MTRGTRGGSSKSAFLFLNSRGLKSCLLDPFNFENFTTAFFSETWLAGDSSLPLIDNKDFFHVPGEKKDRGRPFEGLQLYVNPSLKATLLSCSDVQIAVKLPYAIIIGFYYTPSVDFDDLLLDLSTAINSSHYSLPFIIGGDLNLHPEDHEFSVLTQFLSRHDLSLVSDTKIYTFNGVKNSYRLDYTFVSRTLSSPIESVLNVNCSDHFPVLLTCKFPRKRTDSDISYSSNKKLDLDQCALILQNECFSNIPDCDLIKTIDSIFQFCSVSQKECKKRKPWFDSTSYDLRNNCRALLILSRNDSRYNRDYRLARTAYHTHLRNAKRNHNFLICNNLVEKTKEKGIHALYRAAKPVNAKCSIPIQELSSYCSNLLNVDAGSVNDFQRIPTCDIENHPLLDPFSQNEVHNILLELRSKARSASSPASPHSLKLLVEPLTPILTRVFNLSVLNCHFPTSWSESVMFFLHKKGCRSLPSNYRTISIENPFLKAFMSLLTKRFYSFAESNSLLPDLQFGFRKHRSCLSAASLLYDLAYSRLQMKKRTYVCFVDFSKAFDSVSRPLLFQKLQILGFPHQLCLLLERLYSNIQIRVRSGSTLSSAFKTSVGTLQGDPLSPLLFSLFISDLPKEIPRYNLLFSIILFADDVVLLGESEQNLQTNIDALFSYASSNCLKVNVGKTKCLVFHRGRLPSCSFHLGGSPLELVNSFVYLGFRFSVQLSFSDHVKNLISKASSRLGCLFQQLPLRSLPWSIVLQVFNCFVLPVFLYGVHLWYSRVSNSVLLSLDSFFTKFLKRYLGLPRFISNAIVHFITGTQPLSVFLANFVSTKPFLASFPDSLSGLQFSFLQSLPSFSQYSPLPFIPSSFWLSPVIHSIPSHPDFRRKLILDALGDLALPPWSL